MPSLPPLDIKKNTNNAPHVVILGAGATLAALPNGDLSGLQLPLIKNIVEVVGLEAILSSHGIKDGYDDFEALYDKLASGSTSLVSKLDARIRAYFSKMQLPPEPTIYDLLLLSLRKKDVIATFNWDPLLADAVKRNRKIQNLPDILFLHGNVDVGICLKHPNKGFLEHICNACKKPLEPTPLLFPVKHKDYTSNPFIKSEWDDLRRYMEQCYLLTIFGYSAPKTDFEARSLLLNAWGENTTREFAEIEIVDIKDPKELEDNWSEFFVRQHYSIFDKIEDSLSFRHVRRSCEAFAKATLLLCPWKENRYPNFKSLNHLHKWLRQLTQEEESDFLSGKPCEEVPDYSE